MISGLGWVSDLVTAAGGIDVFPHLATQKNAKDRIVAPEAVIAAKPDIIIGSWCGKKFVPAKVAARPGFGQIPAVAQGWLREIKSTIILQPGPAALTEGLDALVQIVAEWVENQPSAVLERASPPNARKSYRCPSRPQSPPLRCPPFGRIWLWWPFSSRSTWPARLLPHAYGFLPIAASGLFAARVLRLPALAIVVPVAAMSISSWLAFGQDDWRVALIVYVAISIPAIVGILSRGQARRLSALWRSCCPARWRSSPCRISRSGRSAACTTSTSPG